MILVLQGSTLDFRSDFDAGIIARADVEDHAAARSEWHGLFREDVAQFLGDDLIDLSIVEGRTEIQSARITATGTAIVYYGFVDPSGGRHDAMTMAVAHGEDDRLILDALRVATPPFDPAEVTENFATVCKEYRLTTVTGDRYSGEWVPSSFQKHGIVYQPSDLDRSAIYLACLPLFVGRRIELLDHPKLITELRLLERRPRSGGKPDQVDHPPRGFDDAANSALGALRLASAKAATWTAAETIGAIRVSAIPSGMFDDGYHNDGPSWRDAPPYLTK